MGRKALIWYPGATYHITERGNHRNDIFRDVEDYKVYIRILGEVLEKYNAILYCYCMMTNHVHLVIETNNEIISKIMKRLNEFYTRYFNNKYILIGHLFQGRYHWDIVADDSYKLEVSRYIHLNPVKANMVQNPENYKWSSYGMFIGLNEEKLIDSSKILNYYKSINCRELYKKFVEQSIGTGTGTSISVPVTSRNNAK